MPILNQMCFSYAVILLYYLSHGCVGYDPEASITGLYTGPYFDPLAPRNLTAHLEDRAVLPCTVRQLGDKSVSWVRMRDADILTVDRYTFVSDERFEAHYTPTYETWNLIIKYVQERDAGMYECQVSTEPKMSQLFNLRVVVPRVSMVPPGDRYVKAGSKVKIDCHITDVVQQPDYIFWYHDSVRVLEQRDSNIEVNVKKTGEESLMSTLTISRVRRDESGNYTCMPSNLHSASVLLHVLNEEHPEAMKDGRNASGKMEQPIFLLLLFLISTIAGRLFTDYSLPGNKGNKIRFFPDAISDQSNFSLARKYKKQTLLPQTISSPQNRSIPFSNSEIRAEDANLSFGGKDVFLFRQNEHEFLFGNFENQSWNADGDFFEKYISRSVVVSELKKSITESILYRAGELEKMIDLTTSRSKIPTLERNSRAFEPSLINPNDETANSEASNVDMEQEYYELSITDSGKWIAIHSLAEMDSNKYLNIFEDFAGSINIFPYNQRILEIDSSETQR